MNVYNFFRPPCVVLEGSGVVEVATLEDFRIHSALQSRYVRYACNGDTAAGTNFLLQPKATIDMSFNY